MHIQRYNWSPFILILLLIGCSSPNIEWGDLNVIPQPQVVNCKSDQGFTIDKKTVVFTTEDNPTMKRNENFLISFINEVTGITIQSVDQPSSKHVITLSISKSIQKKDGYVMKITPDRISIEGESEAGVFYGIQTLFKALPIVKGENKLAALPIGEIKDFPRFPYRGFMIDVGRHFFPISYLKQMIDMFALHNINYFHWHLSDDQGWRIQIKKYPKLTEIGSVRDSTMIDRSTKEYDGVPHKGFYTQEEARELVRYAAERFITIIPEIDMPGHMTAALASYPELGCTGGPYTIPCNFGVFKEVLCAGNEHTIQFCKDVLEEIMNIFPSEYIHIGGDECPKIRWKECPKCQAKIRQLGLKDSPDRSKENQLQTYFMGEMEKFINTHGRKMIGWDEILEGGLTPNSTVMAWRNPKKEIEAARQYHNTIITPIQYLYFSNPHWNQLQGVNSIKRVYCFEPVSKDLNSEEQKYIIGAQGCIWTETTADSLKMEWQVLPRMAALSEIQWTLPENKNFESFKQRLPKLLENYVLRGYDYRKDIHDTSIIELDVDSIK